MVGKYNSMKIVSVSLQIMLGINRRLLQMSYRMDIPFFFLKKGSNQIKLVAWTNLLPYYRYSSKIHEQDEFRWNLTSYRQFIVKYHSLAQLHNDIPGINRRIWKLKVPLKVKIFLRYLCCGVVLTKNNLSKRNWQGNQIFCFRHIKEAIKHVIWFLQKSYSFAYAGHHRIQLLWRVYAWSM